MTNKLTNLVDNNGASYPLAVSDLTGAFGARLSARFICDNGLFGDDAVRLYEIEDGSFFATTNGDPVPMGWFEDNGYPTLEAAAELVRTNFAELDRQ